MIRSFPILFDPAAIEGGNGTAVIAPPAVETTPDLAKSATGLVDKHGDPIAALKVLLGDNYEYRTKLREAKAKLPPEGSVVLSADEAKVLSAFRAMGTPEELKTALETGKAAIGRATQYEREKIHHQAAALHKFVPSVLTRLAEQDKAEIVIQDAKDRLGKNVKVAAVKGEGDKTTPLTEYAETHWKDFLPALKADATPAAQGGSPAHRLQVAPRPEIVPQPTVRRVNSF